MKQTPEALSFIERVENDLSVRDAVGASLEDEAALRRLFATDTHNPRLNDPHVGLVDLFAAPESLRLTQAREVDETTKDAQYIFPLDDNQRRKTGEPATAVDLDEFKQNWSLFTEGSLSQLFDWNNVIAAGGSVLACLLPLSVGSKVSKRTIRKYYHQEAFPTSDVDLFLWGLTAEQAEAKAIAIYEAVKDAVPWDTTCIRTKNAISIHSQYPYRAVQIVLRLYRSPAEVLAGFDVDACCFAYDGTRVWANPRSIAAVMTQSNTVDMTRRSPSYEAWLTKYSARGFEVHVPTLRRAEVDPTIFERSILRIEGLARLLVLEKMLTFDDRTAYLERRRTLRARPQASHRITSRRRRHKRIKKDLKADGEVAELQMNNYDTPAFHVPHGYEWNAKKIESLIYRTDLGMNSTFNPKNKGRRLHRHPAFFGTMAECLEDCCEFCPEAMDEDERKLQETEDKHYVRGRVQFMQENPGRQSITGSFQPIDVGDWSTMAYLEPSQPVFICIANGDREGVATILGSGMDLRKRDYVGRTPLQLAILCKNTDIACDLIEAGARMIVRVVDGRTALHLASQLGLDKGGQDDRERRGREKRQKKQRREDWRWKQSQVEVDDDPDRPSSDDDWASGSSEPRPKKKVIILTNEIPQPPVDDSSIPEDNDELPDILDINLTDWDQYFTPLAFAIVGGHLAVVETLIAAGADVKTATKAQDAKAQTLHPLTLTFLTETDQVACKIAERLIQAGAIITAADSNNITTFHHAVISDKVKLAETMLRCDPNSSVAVNFLGRPGQNMMLHPLVTAVSRSRTMTAMLVSNGASPVITEADYDRARDGDGSTPQHFYPPQRNFLGETPMPIDVAIRNFSSAYKLFVALGVDVNLVQREAGSYQLSQNCRTLLDLVEYHIDLAQKHLATPDALPDNPPTPVLASVIPSPEFKSAPGSWDEFFLNMRRRVVSDTISGMPLLPANATPQPVVQGLFAPNLPSQPSLHYDSVGRIGHSQPADSPKALLARIAQIRKRNERILAYLQEVHTFLRANGAKSWTELHPFPHQPSISVLPPAGLFQLGAPHFLGTPLAAPNWLPQSSFGASFSNPSLRQPNLMSPGPFEPTSPRLFTFHRSHNRYLYGGNSDPVAEHTYELYRQLFQACWMGDVGLIQDFCLPRHPSRRHENEDPIAIMVIATTHHVPLVVQGDGYTPFSIACQARHWDTCRVILAVATAQYKRHEVNESRFATGGIEFEEDNEDGGEGEEYDSDATEGGRRPEQFTDIATRFSSIRSDVPPYAFFITCSTWLNPEGNAVCYTPLQKAIYENDLEAFLQIVDMMANLDDPLSLTTHELSQILSCDSPALLDAFIRCSGLGIFAGRFASEINIPDAGTTPKFYQGLTIQGKKRTDLAKSGAPFVPQKREDPPLVFQAARSGATNILTYLSSDKPLAAYQAYTIPNLAAKLPKLLGILPNSRNETPVLGALSGSGGLETVKHLLETFPAHRQTYLHGRTKDSGATPLSIGCLHNFSSETFDFFLAQDVDILCLDSRGWNILHQMCFKSHRPLLELVLTKLSPEAIGPMFVQQTNDNKHTPLAFAVLSGRHELVELLLQHEGAKKSLGMRDATGSTPLHVAASNGHYKTVELPLGHRESKASFSKRDTMGSTPLHVAISGSHYQIVEALLGHRESVKPSLNARDAMGSTPLHIAISGGHYKALELLLKTIPDLDLFLENGLGETPAEMATVRYLNFVTRDGFPIRAVPTAERLSTVQLVSVHPNYLDPTNNFHPAPRAMMLGAYSNGRDWTEVDAKDVMQLRELVNGYEAKGELGARDGKLLVELKAFADREEAALDDWKDYQTVLQALAAPVPDAAVNWTGYAYQSPGSDVKKTCVAVLKAVGEAEVMLRNTQRTRHLVPLSDVQRAVFTTLSQTRRSHRVGYSQ